MKKIINSLSVLCLAGALLSCKDNNQFKQTSEVPATHHEVGLTEYIRANFESTNGSKLVCAESVICNNKNLAQIYESLNYVPVWLSDKGELKPEVESTIFILQNSYLDGLDPYRYHVHEINNLTVS